MAFVRCVPDPREQFAHELRVDLVEEAGVTCEVCGHDWDPFELTEQQAAGNDELWHACFDDEEEGSQ